MPLNLVHQTKVQYLRRLRERYRNSERLEACRLASKILRHLADGDVTLVQMQSAWNMTALEWTAKAAQLQARADRWAAFKSSEAAMNSDRGD